MLPRLRYRTGADLWTCERFSGICRTPGAGAGTLRDCAGLSADGFPALQSADFTRRRRDASRRCRLGAYRYGPGADDWVFFDFDEQVNCLTLAYGGMAPGVSVAVAGTQPPFARPVCVPFQNRLLVFPYKLALRTDLLGFTDDRSAVEDPKEGDVWADAAGETCYAYRGGSWTADGPVAEPMETSVTRSVRFQDGTYAGEAAEANTIYSDGADWAAAFAVGDAVTVSGASDPENNKTLVVREIEGACLRFYDHSFTVTATAETVTLARTVPDVQFACANENRVWGCAGQHVWASKLGDWRNWNVFDGLESDSFAVDVLAGGDFTACVSFLGYPVFFRRDAVYKVYGSRPGNFEVLGSACTGAVSGETLAVAGETLFYLSARGVMAYSGGIPVPMSGPLGDLVTGSEDAFGGSDGRRYFFGYRDKTVFVWDTETGTWLKEVFPEAVAHSCGGLAGAVFCTAEGARCGELGSGTALPDAFTAELGETDLGVFAAKYGARLWLRMENAAPVTVAVRFDGGDWETVCTAAAGGKRVRAVSVPLRRCDRFALRFSGSGAWTLWAVGVALRRERNDRKGG